MDSDLFGVRKSVLSELGRDDVRRTDDTSVTDQMACTNLDLCTFTARTTCHCVGADE